MPALLRVPGPRGTGGSWCFLYNRVRQAAKGRIGGVIFFFPPPPSLFSVLPCRVCLASCTAAPAGAGIGAGFSQPALAHLLQEGSGAEKTALGSGGNLGDGGGRRWEPTQLRVGMVAVGQASSTW